MAKDLPTTPKLEKVYKQLPNLYLGTKFKDQSVLRAILLAFCQQDDEMIKQIQNAKAQLFVKTASKQFLDIHANNRGINLRTGDNQDINLSETVLRSVIPNLSYKPKTIKKSIYDLIESFYGKKFTHTSINVSPRSGTIKFENRDTLVVQIDDLDKQTVFLPASLEQQPVTLETLQKLLSAIKGASAEIKDGELLFYSKGYGLSSKIKILGGSIINKILINGNEKTYSDSSFTPISFNFNEKPSSVTVRNSGPREITIGLPGFVNVSEFDKAFFITDYSNKKGIFEQLFDFVEPDPKTYPNPAKDPGNIFPDPPKEGHLYSRDDKDYMLFKYFDLVAGEKLVGEKSNIRIENFALDSQMKSAITKVVFVVLDKILQKVDLNGKDGNPVLDRKPGVETALELDYRADLLTQQILDVRRVSDYYIQLKAPFDFGSVFDGLSTDDNNKTALKKLQISYFYDKTKLEDAQTGDSSMFITSSTADRQFVQKLLEKIIASGVTVKFEVNLDRMPHGISGVYQKIKFKYNIYI